MKTRVKQVRESKGLSQEQVAADLGVKLSTYRSWEQGSRGFNGEKITMLADYFKVSADTLLGTQFAEPLSEQVSLDETDLLDSYRQLNDRGKSIARDVVDALAECGKYDN